MPIKDPDKLREYKIKYNHARYCKNKDYFKQKLKDRRAAIWEWYYEYKNHLYCEKCGENHPGCLDFHHKNPSEKDVEVCYAVKNGWGKERILAEIAKCIVLCANCHRKLHWSQTPRIMRKNNSCVKGD